MDVFLVGLTGALPHGLAFEHPEHSPAWNCCYTGKRKGSKHNIINLYSEAREQHDEQDYIDAK